MDIHDVTRWVFFTGGAGLAYTTVLIGWFWKTELRRCQRCRQRGMNCLCMGGSR
jgi:hypothetical protein